MWEMARDILSCVQLDGGSSPFVSASNYNRRVHDRLAKGSSSHDSTGHVCGLHLYDLP